MNKKTRAIDENTFSLIIGTIRQGFCDEGVRHKPNDRIATILVLEYKLGISNSEVLNLSLNDFVKDGDKYRLDLYCKKTRKFRNVMVECEVHQFIKDYAYRNGICMTARLFPITERAVLKHLKATVDFLGVEGVGSRSFRTRNE